MAATVAAMSTFMFCFLFIRLRAAGSGFSMPRNTSEKPAAFISGSRCASFADPTSRRRHIVERLEDRAVVQCFPGSRFLRRDCRWDEKQRSIVGMFASFTPED